MFYIKVLSLDHASDQKFVLLHVWSSPVSTAYYILVGTKQTPYYGAEFCSFCML